jgi:hypothetical protein
LKARKTGRSPHRRASASEIEAGLMPSQKPR